MNLFKKGILTGIGLGLFAKERVEESAQKLAEEARMSEDETKEFIEEIKQHAEKTRTQIDEKIQAQVKEQIEKMGLATHEDINRLEKKIDALKRQKKSTSGEKKSGEKSE